MIELVEKLRAGFLGSYCKEDARSRLEDVKYFV